MKVLYQYGIGAMIGTLDGAVHWKAHSGQGGYLRRWVMPRLTAQNELIGAKGANIATLWQATTAAYKADWRTYAQRYFSEHASDGIFDPNRSPYGFWTKALFAWEKSDPQHVDLTSINMEDLTSLGTFGSTVAATIQFGFVPMIQHYDDLSASITT